jgi:hypothetical protein
LIVNDDTTEVSPGFVKSVEILKEIVLPAAIAALCAIELKLT